MDSRKSQLRWKYLKQRSIRYETFDRLCSLFEEDGRFVNFINRTGKQTNCLINQKLSLDYQEDKFFYQANPSNKENTFGQLVSSSTSTRISLGNFSVRWFFIIIKEIITLFRRLFIHIWGLFLTITGVLQLRQIQSASVPCRICRCWWRFRWHGDHFQWRGQTFNRLWRVR